jgi:hypothetical protein
MDNYCTVSDGCGNYEDGILIQDEEESNNDDEEESTNWCGESRIATEKIDSITSSFSNRTPTIL